MRSVIESIRRERTVRRALHAIARQRAAMILQPGNVVVVEQSAPDEEWFYVAVQTCHIRGWAEVLHESMPTAAVRFEGSKPVFPSTMAPKTVWRLTEGGWSVINRSHGWIIATFTVGVLSLLAGLASVFVALYPDAVR
jgi:hypothetical protein